jgi:hypothetical protein
MQNAGMQGCRDAEMKNAECREGGSAWLLHKRPWRGL